MKRGRLVACDGSCSFCIFGIVLGGHPSCIHRVNPWSRLLLRSSSGGYWLCLDILLSLVKGSVQWLDEPVGICWFNIWAWFVNLKLLSLNKGFCPQIIVEICWCPKNRQLRPVTISVPFELYTNRWDKIKKLSDGKSMIHLHDSMSVIPLQQFH